MDLDLLEGLPSTEELADDKKADATPVPTTDAVPAAPVDVSSANPEPLISAPAAVTEANKEPAITETEAVAPAAVEKAASPVAPPKEREQKEKEEPQKPAEEKVAATPSSGIPQIPEGPRVDVSAATVARMMGIASTNDLRVLEGRIDLLTSKVAAILTKVDRSLSMFSSIPTASDIGRLEVQLAAVKTMMKELFDAVGAPVSSGKERADKDVAAEQSRKLREGIKTNTES